MKWLGRDESSNVEDRRGFGRAGMAIGGGGGLILFLLAMLFGVDPRSVQVPQSGPPPSAHTRRTDPAEDKLASFSKVVFRDTEVVWQEQFEKMGRRYVMPTLVLYSGFVDSGCGSAQAAVGPFYCPRDARVYIDLSFYKDMERKLSAPGDFARAYVIAHEVGHHVQNLMGYRFHRGWMNDAREKNRMSVKMELQADFLAGVWAHHAQSKFNFLEDGDLDEALNAAFQIGDDRLQQRSRGYVVPDSFTHGTSEQRISAFRQGFTTGDMRLMRTFFSSSDLAE